MPCSPTCRVRHNASWQTPRHSSPPSCGALHAPTVARRWRDHITSTSLCYRSLVADTGAANAAIRFVGALAPSRRLNLGREQAAHAVVLVGALSRHAPQADRTARSGQRIERTNEQQQQQSRSRTCLRAFRSRSGRILVHTSSGITSVEDCATGRGTHWCLTLGKRVELSIYLPGSG